MKSIFLFLVILLICIGFIGGILWMIDWLTAMRITLWESFWLWPMIVICSCYLYNIIRKNRAE